MPGRCLIWAVSLLLTGCHSGPAIEAPDNAAPATVVVNVSPSETIVGNNTDPQSGLLIAAGWEQVRNNCSACHSLRLVTQNRGSRDTWLGLIRWMQDKQGLWPLEPVIESEILDYLAANYGPLPPARRQPLPPSLLPPAPSTPTAADP